MEELKSSDQEKVQSVQGCDSQCSLPDIVERYSDMLFKIAYIRLKNIQDAEDVVQEVFYQYLKRVEGFEDSEHEKAWLIRVTLNACGKIWRSAWNRHRDDYGLEAYEQIFTERQLAGPEEGFLEADICMRLLKAVKALPAKYRDVIHLFYYEEMAIKEIAEVTGRKESTVTSQLTRGRELLRKRLKEDYDFT